MNSVVVVSLEEKPLSTHVTSTNTCVYNNYTPTNTSYASQIRNRGQSSTGKHVNLDTGVKGDSEDGASDINYIRLEGTPQ